MESIGRYRIVRELAGEYTALYEAHDPAFGKTVHVATAASAKLSPEDYAGTLQGFRRSVRASARLTHAGVVPAYEAGEIDGIAYLATAPAAFDTLKSRMQDGVPWPIGDALQIVSALLDILDSVQRDGIVYRNVNPADILLEANGAVRLADFSLAFFMRPSDPSEQEEAGAMVGTMAYMSPEQIAGKAFDGRSDLFAAGIVTYMLLTGKHPFQRDGQWQIAKSILQDTPPKPSEVNPLLPAECDAIVMKALAKDPDERYPCGHDFSAALWNALCADDRDIRCPK